MSLKKNHGLMRDVDKCIIYIKKICMSITIVEVNVTVLTECKTNYKKVYAQRKKLANAMSGYLRRNSQSEFYNFLKRSRQERNHNLGVENFVEHFIIWVSTKTMNILRVI